MKGNWWKDGGKIVEGRREMVNEWWREEGKLVEGWRENSGGTEGNWRRDREELVEGQETGCILPKTG